MENIKRKKLTRTFLFCLKKEKKSRINISLYNCRWKESDH